MLRSVVRIAWRHLRRGPAEAGTNRRAGFGAIPYFCAICPGWIDWEGKKRSFAPELRASAIAQMPMGRVGSDADIAGAVLFLASDFASYITGATLDVNGGLYMA